MGLPPIDEQTGYLPHGDWEATLEEIETGFGIGIRRREIMKALRDVVGRLRSHGVQAIWVDGSFAGIRHRPSDADVIYEVPAGEDTTKWGLLAPMNHDRLRSLERIDPWPMPSYQRTARFARQQTIKEFMETDRNGVSKGHIRLKE